MEIQQALYVSPIGEIRLESSADSLRYLWLPGKDEISSRDVSHVVSDGYFKPMQQVLDFLDRYFHGGKTTWNVELDGLGSPFFKAVWAEAIRIPYGQVLSYGELAARSGSPKAARAVGLAMARNPLPILIPCHRVLASNGGLGGYGGGLDMKRWLLRHEGYHIQ